MEFSSGKLNLILIFLTLGPIVFIVRLIMKYVSSLRQVHFLYHIHMDLISSFKRILYVTYIASFKTEY